MDGLILVDKPPKLTSHDIVIQIRNILNFKKIGHCGTLDPLATGLMIIAVGKATKLFPFLSKANKTYRGQIRLGFSTDTYDSTGNRTSPEKKEYPDCEILKKNMKKFVGEIKQVPPLYSAKKYKGRPLYELARRNEKIVPKPIQISVLTFQLMDYHPPEFDFEVKCSSGTYIRSLAHDLGERLKCGAHLSELTRVEFGDYKLEESFSLEKIKELVKKRKFQEFLIPMEFLLPEFPKIILKEKGTILAKNGNKISIEDTLTIFHKEPCSLDKAEKNDIYRLFSLNGKFVALGRIIPEKKLFHPFLVIDSKDINQ
jgi:tRNA pseudouridine55 synthase